jgi:ferredoxin
MTFRVEFPGTSWSAVELPHGAILSEWLTAMNSPALFGCRTGICGTCLIEVEEVGASGLPPPASAEIEALDIYAPGNPKARLACQIRLTADIRLTKIDAL